MCCGPFVHYFNRNSRYLLMRSVTLDLSIISAFVSAICSVKSHSFFHIDQRDEISSATSCASAVILIDTLMFDKINCSILEFKSLDGNVLYNVDDKYHKWYSTLCFYIKYKAHKTRRSSSIK